MSKLKLVTTLVFASLALALLGGLSLWQLLRWQEKENQAALLASRNLVPALSLEAALQKQAKGDNLKGEIINLDGMFQNSATLYKLASHKGGPAWELITPLITKSGKIVLVDRGLIPQEGRIFFETMQEKTDVKIRAIVMTLRGQQGIFDPENDPEANIWYWWDLAAMKAALKLENEQELAPFIVQELSPPSTCPLKPRCHHPLK